MSEIKNSNKYSIKSFISAFNILLKGIGQIMLQENSITGLLILLGIFYSSPEMSFAALLGSIVGTTTATLLKYNKSDITKGIYGFNAALFGVAVLLFLKPAYTSWLIIIAGSIITVLIQNFFSNWKFPIFTLPFVLTTWLLIFIDTYFKTAILNDVTPAFESTKNYWSIGFKGYSQVIFQNNFITGLLFFIAVSINAPISALYGFLGALLSSIIAYIFIAPLNEINAGIYGFNAVLCAIVFAGTNFRDAIWVMLSVLLSLLFSHALSSNNIIQLTFPFVASSILVSLLKNKSLLNTK